MKIIGENRYKDFFDQMIYSYGIDEAVVLDRTIYHAKTFAKLDLAGVGFRFPHQYWYWHNDKYKQDLSPQQRYKKLITDIRNASYLNHKSYAGNEPYEYIILYYQEKLYCLYYKRQFDALGQVILINEKTLQTIYHHKIKMLYEFDSQKPLTNPALKKLILFSQTHKMPYFVLLNHNGTTLPYTQFFPLWTIHQYQTIFDVVETYQYIENFILENIAEPSIQSNNNKITAHGFDLKSSFRHAKNSHKK